MTHDIGAALEAGLAATMAQFNAAQRTHQTLSMTAMAQNKESRRQPTAAFKLILDALGRRIA